MKRRVSFEVWFGPSQSADFPVPNTNGGCGSELPPDSTRHLCYMTNPPKHYVVTYTLAPKTGKFYVHPDSFYNRTCANLEHSKDPQRWSCMGPSWQNCKLPREWGGHRVNRRVKVIEE